MTNYSLEQFYHLVSKNETLQSRLGEASSLEAFFKLAVELGQNQGYYFTAEEVKTAIAQKQSQGYELSDEQLVAVAGGKGEGGNGDIAAVDFDPIDDDIFHTATQPAPEDNSFFCPVSDTIHNSPEGVGGGGGLSWS